MDIKRLSLDEWEELLPSSGFEVFHTPEALSVLDMHTSGDLTLLGGFKGDEPVALLPAFVRQGPVGRAVLSPPPRMGVPRLGPVVTPNSPKQSKREAVTRRFVDGVIDELDAGGVLSIVRMRCGLGFNDPRPFHWNDFSVEPAFTYVLDVDGHEMDTLLQSFSYSLRQDFKHGEESELTVSVESADGAEPVVDQVIERYEEQEQSAPLDATFALELVDSLGDRARVYVARDPDGRYLGGIIALISNDAVYYWQGGVGASYEEVLEDGSTRSFSVNGLLHRSILEDILTDPDLDTVNTYDLVGANTRRLSQYKSQFGGTLTPYYIVESTGAGTKLAKSGFQLIDGQK